ncbi:MAG: ATP-binding protein [Rhodothermales bacterium]
MLRHVLKGVLYLTCIAGISARIAWGQSVMPPPLPANKALTQFVLSSWNRDDGLPQNTVSTVAQTTDGYIWFGTQEGLVRFDGVELKVYDANATGTIYSNTVRSLLGDRNGDLWIGTQAGGILRYHDQTFTPVDSLVDGRITGLLQRRNGDILVSTQEAFFSIRDTLVTAITGYDGGIVGALLEDTRSDAVWIGTLDGQIIRLADGVFSRPFPLDVLESAPISSLAQSTMGALWVGTKKSGLFRITEGRVEHFSTREGLPSDNISVLLTDSDNQLWVGTNDAGIFRMPSTPVLPVPDRDRLTQDEGLTSNSIRSLMIDREGSLWIGVDAGGVNQLHESKVTPITHYQGLPDEHVYPIYVEPSGVSWFGTEKGALRLDLDGSTTIYDQKNGMPADFVLSFAGTPDGSVWLGTTNGLVRMRNSAMQVYTSNDGLPDNSIFGLYTDRAGQLWIATSGGASRFDGRTFTTYSTDDGLTSNYVTVFLEDHEGALWIGTYDGGLNRLKDGTIVPLTKEEGLSTDGILSLHEDGAGVLWVGTYGGGLNRIEDGVITVITSSEGLFNDKVFQILEDESRRLWISSNIGLYTISRDEVAALAAGRIDRITSQVYDRHDGLLSQEFTGGIQPAGWQSSDGRLWFPTDRGAVVVSPSHMRFNAQPPPVAIRHVGVNTELRFDGTSYTLPAGTSRLEIDYTALTFVSPTETTYRYILEGEDDDWIEAGTQRTAHYRNLAPGAYTFRVIARNADGVWSEAPATFTFYLEPFFYQTVWFYLIIGLIIFLAIIGGHKLSVAKLVARERELAFLVAERTHDLQVEKEKTEEAKAVIEAQADKLRELDRFKTRFFANVSHEFRTPLTMIIGPIENALNGTYGAVDDRLGRQLDIMRRNALRLMRLINQLLDLSKLEAGKMQLRTRPLDIVRFLQDVMLTVSPFAEKKGIELAFSSSHPTAEVYFEPDKFEKVFYNLLSNATKFTPTGGRIAMTVTRLDDADGRLEVRVQDTGRGIPADHLPHIFDRFHQVDGSNTREHEGTGIGLALVKEMIEIHGGSVRVESEPGAGTTFIITLQTGAGHLAQDQITANTEDGYEPQAGVAFDEAHKTPETPQAPRPKRVAPASAPVVLVVDDNPDLRDYLESILAEHYRVVQACDGVEGLDTARAIRPDLIVSDVMMPRMDGHAMCRAIKQDEALCHTPLILLTARATSEMMLEGLEEGADDYMAKPFNARELLARVRNLLMMREQQLLLSRSNEALRESNDHLTRANETLIQRTAELIEALAQNNEILGVASHDLKNPLAGIIGLAELILESIRDSTDDDMKAEALECITLLHSEAARMLRIIKELLDKHREGEQLALNKEHIDLNDIIETALRWNHQQAIHKQIDIHFARASSVAVEVDVDAIMRVVDNLVSNAVKYSPPGSQVWVGLEHENNGAILRVRDEGPGLTQEDLDRVFGKGQQLSAKPTGGEHSTGLGLYIVKQLIEQHEGEVGVESVAGEGATFWFRLPVLEPETQTAS